MRYVAARRTLVFFLFISTIFVVGRHNHASAADGNAWRQEAEIQEIAPVTSKANTGNTECEFMTFQSRYIFKEKYVNSKLTYDSQTYEDTGRTYSDVCVAQNKHGLLSTTGVWSKNQDKNSALPIDAGRYSILPSPGGTATVFSDVAPIYGLQYSINHNLEYVGSLSTKTYGSGVAARKEKTWKIDTSKLDEFLSYSDNTVTRFYQIGFSSNGRFAVVLLANRGFARLDLQTKELTPFYNSTLTSGVGVFMNISNDGRYVTTAKSATSHFFVHDLAGCQSSYAYGSWPGSGTLQTVGCESRSAFSDVQKLYPTVETISGLRFSPNASMLSIIVSYKVGTNTVSKYARLQATGYQSSPQGYLAMGDSFSSGEGDLQGGDWYEFGTDEQGSTDTFAGRNLCHLSRRSYPYLMAMKLGYLTTNSLNPPANGLFHSVACSGAKIHNITGIVGEKQNDGTAVDFAITDNQYRYQRGSILDNWQPGFERQVGFITGRADNITTRNPFSPEVITISIGGNDAGFGQKLLACLLPGTCEFAQNEAVRSRVAIELASEKSNLEKTYKQIKESAPDARIYVVGYPQFVQASPETCGSNVHLDNDEATFVNFATAYFNSVIKAATQSAGVVYVDVEDILVNINLCSGSSDEVMAVNGITAGNDIALSPVDSGMFRHGLCLVRKCVGSESYHPNQKGHQEYKTAVLLATNGLTLGNPAIEQTSVPTPSDYFGLESRIFVDRLNANPHNPVDYAKMEEMIQSASEYRKPSIRLEGLLPYSQVSFEIHSTPTGLGAATVDENGEIELTLTIPESVAGGYHEIHVSGYDTLGASIQLYEPILLGSEETDFDGDGLQDDYDSCPAVQNSSFDIDNDELDDACDNDLFIPKDESPEEAPTTEGDDIEPVGNTDNSAENEEVTDSPITDLGMSPPTPQGNNVVIATDALSATNQTVVAQVASTQSQVLGNARQNSTVYLQETTQTITGGVLSAIESKSSNVINVNNQLDTSGKITVSLSEPKSGFGITKFIFAVIGVLAITALVLKLLKL